MPVVVTEKGFTPDDWAEGRVLPFDFFWSGQDLPEEDLAVEFPNDRDPADLVPWLDRLAMIRVAFPAMGDGRGFSIARRLRALGFRGRLRAAGPADRRPVPRRPQRRLRRGGAARSGRRAPAGMALGPGAAPFLPGPPAPARIGPTARVSNRPRRATWLPEKPSSGWRRRVLQSSLRPAAPDRRCPRPRPRRPGRRAGGPRRRIARPDDRPRALRQLLAAPDRPLRRRLRLRGLCRQLCREQHGRRARHRTRAAVELGIRPRGQDRRLRRLPPCRLGLLEPLGRRIRGRFRQALRRTGRMGGLGRVLLPLQRLSLGRPCRHHPRPLHRAELGQRHLRPSRSTAPRTTRAAS
jgi:hypothetical protein